MDREFIEQVQAQGVAAAEIVRALALDPADIESLQAESVEALDAILEGIGCLEIADGSAHGHSLRQSIIPPHEK